MSESGDVIESLVDAVIDGRCDEAGLRRFEELVRNDPRAREAYLDQMRMHALLEWRHGRGGSHVDRAGPPRRPWLAPGLRPWGLAAGLLPRVGPVLPPSPFPR